MTALSPCHLLSFFISKNEGEINMQMNFLNEMANDTRVLLHGDCLEKLKELPDDSVDSVVTDPPYGLSKEPDITEVLTKWMTGEPYDHNHKGFMGKEWDSFVPHPDIWKEVFRVLKPGGHALVFAGARTQDLMTISLRLAGFEVRDVIEWIYFSGFPKSLDVSKAFDKRRDEDGPRIRAVTKFISEGRKKAKVTQKSIDEHFGFNGMASHWCSQGSQAQVPKMEQWEELKKLINLTDEMDEEVKELNARKGKPSDDFSRREVLKSIPNRQKREYDGANGVANFAGGSSKNDAEHITAPATTLAQKWEGWGTELKPAHEPIIMVRKPLHNGRHIVPVTGNIEKWGTGAINIDSCRVGDERLKASKGSAESNGKYANRVWDVPEREGRFPANCITLESNQFYSKHFNVSSQELSKKASKKDRNSDWQGVDIALDKKMVGYGGNEFGMNANEYRPDGSKRKPITHKNNHPTVKPTDLMAWLVRLITPPEGVVLDLFAGSGSTLVAAKREGFGFIGIEREKEYIEICEARTGEVAE